MSGILSDDELARMVDAYDRAQGCWYNIGGTVDADHWAGNEGDELLSVTECLLNHIDALTEKYAAAVAFADLQLRCLADELPEGMAGLRELVNARNAAADAYREASQ